MLRSLALLAPLSPLATACVRKQTGTAWVATDVANDQRADAVEDRVPVAQRDVALDVANPTHVGDYSDAYCRVHARTRQPPYLIVGMEAEMNCGLLLRTHLGEPCVQPGFSCTNNTISFAYSVSCPVDCPRVWTAASIGGPHAPPELLA